MVRQLDIRLLVERFALARLPPGAIADLPLGQQQGAFAAVIHSAEGISLICPQGAVPAGAQSRNGFRCFEVAGIFDLESVGVVAAVAQPLAGAGVSLFAYSTWQTDYIFVHESELDKALAALRQAGHRVAAGEQDEPGPGQSSTSLLPDR